MFRFAIPVALALAAAIASATAYAQEEEDVQQDNGDSRVVAVLPIPVDSPIRVEVLDPVTLELHECVTGRTTSANGNERSRANLVIPADCVEGISGNLRLCWSADDCVPFAFEAGGVFDLGEVTTSFFMSDPPAVGIGPTAHVAAGGPSPWILRTALAAGVMGALAVAGAGALHTANRRRA
jgi:hypothetical protein